MTFKFGWIRTAGLLLSAPAWLASAALAAGVRAGPEDAEIAARALAEVPQHGNRTVCSSAAPGHARCLARVRVGPDGQVQSSASPSGLTPADIQAAYGIPAGAAGSAAAAQHAPDGPVVA